MTDEPLSVWLAREVLGCKVRQFKDTGDERYYVRTLVKSATGGKSQEHFDLCPDYAHPDGNRTWELLNAMVSQGWHVQLDSWLGVRFARSDPEALKRVPSAFVLQHGEAEGFGGEAVVAAISAAFGWTDGETGR